MTTDLASKPHPKVLQYSCCKYELNQYQTFRAIHDQKCIFFFV